MRPCFWFRFWIHHWLLWGLLDLSPLFPRCEAQRRLGTVLFALLCVIKNSDSESSNMPSQRTIAESKRLRVRWHSHRESSCFFSPFLSLENIRIWSWIGGLRRVECLSSRSSSGLVNSCTMSRTGLHSGVCEQVYAVCIAHKRNV